MKLPKSGRLHHRSLQESLFRLGSAIYTPSLKLIWRAVDGPTLTKGFRDRVPPLIGPVQVLVSVPKRRRRKAVDRVLMRRRIREAYRASALPLFAKVNDLTEVRTLSVALVYSKDCNLDYLEVREDMEKLIEKLIGKLEKRYQIKTTETKDNEKTAQDSDCSDGTSD